jgi:hypothetical protein
MKLGVAVVYLVGERNEPLLDLHLDQIEKNTEVPYTIYAACNRLLPQYREKLAQNPRVKIWPCRTYVSGTGLLRQDEELAATKGLAFVDSKYEHSWYLEQLIRGAIDDGCTHVAILHVDSFPVRPGWAQELSGMLSERCVLAGVTRDTKTDHKPLTAGILFARDFYLKYHPRLLLSQEEIDSDEYERYRQASPHSGGSGVGYGFKIFTEGLTWYPLERSNVGGTHALLASIHGDLIFHLMATAVVEEQQGLDFTVRASQRRGLTGAVARIACAVLPERFRGKIRRRLAEPIKALHRSGDRRAWEQERRMLFEDPDRYLIYLRTGVKDRPARADRGPTAQAADAAR